MNKFIFVLMILLMSPTCALAGENYHHQKPKKKIVVVKKTVNKTLNNTTNNTTNNYVENTTVENNTNVFNEYLEQKNQYGAKLDVPDLIRLTDNVSFGLETSKDLYHTDAKEGWAGYAKFTVKWTLLDLRKK